jgi:WD40 repeat protein
LAAQSAVARFSEKRMVLLVANLTGRCTIWSVRRCRQIGSPLTGRSCTVESVTLSPDGRTLVTGSVDGAVLLWDVAYLADIIPHLCTSLRHSFTRAEWARYVPPGPAYRQICP